MEDNQQHFFAGMSVYDYDDHKVGKVARYDQALGYFETEGAFSGPRYIPFSAIECIGPTGAHLNVTKDVVSEIYKRMPSVKPTVRDGKLTGGGTAESGWTGRRVPLDAEAIGALREMIHAGTTVFDVDDKKLGSVEAYDAKSGYMRIEKGSIAPKDVFLPVTSVAFLDDKGIHLSLSKEAIAYRFTRMPDVAWGFFANP